MARLQILELPTEHNGDDMVTPFILVIDEYEPMRYIHGIGDDPQPVDEFAATAELTGARAVLAFRETVHIPASDPAPSADDIEVGDADFTEMASAVRRALGIDMTQVGVKPDIAGWLLTACRELEKSEAARHHLNSERDQLKAKLQRARNEPDEATPEDGPNCADVPNCDGQCCAPRNEVEDKRGPAQFYGAKLTHLGGLLDEARVWARHGYEIGQRHCSWTDHGVAPAWLTEGWPRSFDSCEHLQKAAEYDEALTRVRAEVARIRTITPTWDPVADLIEAALNGTQPPAERTAPDA